MNRPRALTVAERIRDAVSRQPVDIFEGAFRVTLSVGVAASSEASPTN